MILVDPSIDIDQYFYSLILVLRMIYPIFVSVKHNKNYGGRTDKLYSS